MLVNNNHRNVPKIKRSLQSTVDERLPIDNSRFRSHQRDSRLGRKLHSMKLKNPSNILQSIGTSNKKLRVSHRIRPEIDNRLKRFRMLDPDEFKEMLNTLSQQMPHEQLKGFNNLDAIGGLQVENYWTRK
ncbi:unnamed protein product [Rotaria sp. Silwood1]|nr:unnamed protein product [Rotaria sp. Silwood1]CAF3371343.1 unnamed protein product [Rotaria sp. Silwood1]CAF3410827.1 unnamed protein product [Rotaria sp. Silwood1]CAF4777637.1 unnamed protein product [Rotaria sp. Silwood1]